MSIPSPSRFYAYVDESGQETEGRFFVVSVVVLGSEHEAILTQLEAIEQRSKKGKAKWHRARYVYRQAYIDELANLSRLTQCLFFEEFRQSQKYFDMTVTATAHAIQRKVSPGAKVVVFVDGLRKQEASRFDASLRAKRVGIKKVRGVQKEQNNAFIRLADALCGLVRDAEEGQPRAVDARRRLQRRGLLAAL